MDYNIKCFLKSLAHVCDLFEQANHKDLLTALALNDVPGLATALHCSTEELPRIIKSICDPASRILGN
jgi:hypothetical protein